MSKYYYLIMYERINYFIISINYFIIFIINYINYI